MAKLWGLPGAADGLSLPRGLTQSELDASQGFCTLPITSSQLLRATRRQPYRLIPRHVITLSSQPEGANLIGRMMPTRSFLCSPLRPAQHVAPVASCVTDAEWTALMAADAWQGAGEDWPGAYRQSPISPSEALGCVRYVFGTTNGKPWLSRFIVPCSLDFRWQ